MSDNALQAAAFRGRQEQLQRKLPPTMAAAVNREMALIGAVINAADGIGAVQQISLHPREFFDHRTRVTWQALVDLANRNAAIDVISVETEIAKTGKLDAVGGAPFLGECSFMGGGIDAIESYADGIRKAHLRRRVYETIGDLYVLGQRDELDGPELLSESMARLAAIEVEQPDGAMKIGTVIEARFAEIERMAIERLDGDRPMSGFSTGIERLNEFLGGYQPGIVTVIAARPAMGKSAAMLSCAYAVSAQPNLGVHVFSLEDSARAYADRMFARGAGVSTDRLRKGDVNRLESSRLVQAVGQYRVRDNWLLDARGGLSGEEIVRSVRRHKQRNHTRVVIVDYLNLVKAEQRMFNEHATIGYLMTLFAEAAKADDVAYVIAAQLNRKLEDRTDRRPALSDLRESGSIEERAKCVIGLYRGAAYPQPGKPQRGIDYQCDCEQSARTCQHTPSQEEWQRQAQCIVLKNSNGPTGSVYARWDGPRVMMW